MWQLLLVGLTTAVHSAVSVVSKLCTDCSRSLQGDSVMTCSNVAVQLCTHIVDVLPRQGGNLLPHHDTSM